MKKRNKAKVGAAAMARSTQGRARTFKDRKKERSRRACRGRIVEE